MTHEQQNIDRAYPSLAEIPEPVDIVDVFHNPMYLDEVVDEAIAVGARATGMKVVSNRCIRTEHERLHIPVKPVGTRQSYW